MLRQREQLVRFCRKQINGFRGVLAEFSEAMGKCREAMARGMPVALARAEERLKIVIDLLRKQWERIEKDGQGNRSSRRSVARLEERRQGSEDDQRDSWRWAAAGNSIGCVDGSSESISVWQKVMVWLNATRLAR